MEKKVLNLIKKMPKVELHLHLDGSLDVNYVKEKYKLTDKQINEKMIADEKCHNLNDYLTKFDFPISIMQTKQELENAVYNLLEKLKNQNVIYVEMRFAPQFHTKGGLSQDKVVQTVIRAKNKVDIKSNVILCIMRGKDNEKENYETVKIAKKYLNKGVCAVDLAGAEAVFKTYKYNKIFEFVKENNIPFTIHAGEADGIESINSAIDFGAKRIGHGVRAIEDEATINRIRENKITLEVCPTSNIQTCICNDYTSHPISMLYFDNVKTTINTDNMTVSNTTLENEYEKLMQNTNLSINDIVKMNINSVNAAFISENEKQELLIKIKDFEAKEEYKLEN